MSGDNLIHGSEFHASTTCWYSGTMTWVFGFITRNVSACFVPTGQRENSPAFQRREKRRATSVPQGRLNRRQIVSAIANDFVLQTSTVPSGLVIVLRPRPGVKTPGYCQMFLRNGQTPLSNARPGRLKFISTNTVRRIRCDVFSATPEIPPETSSCGDVLPVP